MIVGDQKRTAYMTTTGQPGGAMLRADQGRRHVDHGDDDQNAESQNMGRSVETKRKCGGIATAAVVAG